MRKCQIWSYVGGTCNIRFAFHKSNTLQIDKCTLILPLIDRIKFLGNIYCDSHNGPLLFLSIPLWGKWIKTLGPSSSGFMFSDMNNATPLIPHDTAALREQGFTSVKIHTIWDGVNPITSRNPSSCRCCSNWGYADELGVPQGEVPPPYLQQKEHRNYYSNGVGW